VTARSPPTLIDAVLDWILIAHWHHSQSTSMLVLPALSLQDMPPGTVIGPFRSFCMDHDAWEAAQAQTHQLPLASEVPAPAVKTAWSELLRR